MSIIIPANSAAGGSLGYQVANGVRLDDGSSSNFSDGSAPGGNRQKFTWSAWFKRSSVGATQILASSSYSGGDEGYLFLSGGGVLGWQSTNSGDGNLGTNMLWRDLSAWYHVVFSVDTTQSTATNRIKLYVNGSQYTWDNNTTQPNQNQSLYFNVGGSYNTYIGRRAGGDYFDGYMSEIVFIDNAQLAADSFGEFDSDSGVWKPLESVADLTFGTSGYYLNFQNSSALGTDVSGVGNTLTANNLTAVDQTTDTCTNNFATLNPLSGSLSNNTLSEGNVTVQTTSGWRWRPSTIAPSSGKWYAEFKPTSGSTIYTVIGVTPQVSWDSIDGETIGTGAGGENKSVGYSYDGNVYKGNSAVYSGSSYTGSGDIIGVAMDLDNFKVYFAKNNTWQNSGNPESGATGTGAVALDSTLSDWSLSTSQAGTTVTCNYGNPAFTGTDKSDGNNRGSFEYAPPAGYLALCSLNLSEVLS